MAIPSGCGTGIARLDLAGGTTAVTGGSVAVVAFFVSHKQAVATCGLAAQACGETEPASLYARTIGRATVPAVGVVIVTDLTARDAPIAADNRGMAGLT
jgi:hypothetical protein